MKYSSFFVISFLVCGCSVNPQADTESGISCDVQEQLSFEPLNYPEMLGSTMQILKQGSSLFLNDFHGDTLIHRYNLKTGLVEGKLVVKGSGPGEMIPPLELQLSSDSLWILSRPMHLLGSIPVRGNVSVGEGMMLKVRGEADCYVPLGNSRFVFSGYWKEHRYACAALSSADGSYTEFGSYPDFWEEEQYVPIAAKAMFHQSRFALNEKRHQFAVSSYYALEIYEYTPSSSQLPRLQVKKKLGNYAYDYTDGKRISAKLREGSDLACADVMAGDDYLYLLIQDRDNRKHRNILVMDWKGHPVKLLKSNKRITCFCIDEKEGKGYCIIRDPEDTLVSFSLSSVDHS